MNAVELTFLAEQWLCREFPDAIVVRELSLADWGSARVDVAAITADEIVGVEIKGDGDSPTRLPLQGALYGRVCRRMYLLASEGLSKRCEKKRPRGWGKLEVFEGSVREKSAWSVSGSWVRPEPHRLRQHGPWEMCGTLWHSELKSIYDKLGLPRVRGRMTVPDLSEAIVSACPAPKLHDLMICELRNRQWSKHGKPVIDLRNRQLGDLS